MTGNHDPDQVSEPEYNDRLSDARLLPRERDRPEDQELAAQVDRRFQVMGEGLTDGIRRESMAELMLELCALALQRRKKGGDQPTPRKAAEEILKEQLED